MAAKRTPKGVNRPAISKKADPSGPKPVDLDAVRAPARPVPTTNGHGMEEANRQAAKKTEDTA